MASWTSECKYLGRSQLNPGKHAWDSMCLAGGGNGPHGHVESLERSKLRSIHIDKQLVLPEVYDT